MSDSDTGVPMTTYPLLGLLAALALSSSASAETATFKYDGLGRLTQAFKQGGGADGTLATIASDPADNRANYAVVNTVKTLRANDRLSSADNRFYLTLQTNGNLAVVTAATSAVLWASGTTSQTADRATFRSDGNLLVVSPSSTTLWQSATASHPAAQLTMQNDGNLVIKDDTGAQLWQSNTGGL